MNLKTVTAFLLCFMLVMLLCKGYQLRDKSVNDSLLFVSEREHFDNIYAIPLPAGYKRKENQHSSFAHWLQQIQIKKDTTVYLFNGVKKNNQHAQFAVLDISVGNKNLQQCADAVMRLRAEYLFSQKQFDKVIFTDNDGGIYLFKPPFNRTRFSKYLQIVFGMCGTASLSKQMKAVPMKDIRAGDVLIRGGFPGHAVIVMDVANNNAGEKIYLLAQSYMPAQDIHILKNPLNKTTDPWYKVSDAFVIETPEYNFTKNELKRW